MRFPRVHGTIRRRLLVNFRVDPDVIANQLPPPFRPKLQDGWAIAGICLIRLENIRPRRFPAMMGLSSENAAHRIAVVWRDGDGWRDGVYIPRRDTGSLVSHLLGGRVFPGEHQRAAFRIAEGDGRIDLNMRSADGRVEVEVVGREAAALPEGSVFKSVDEASAFFESGSIGYSVTSSANRLDGVALRTASWRVAPLAVERARSSYFADPALFPAGSVDFDCALIMRDTAHEWEAADDLYV
jgi:uncharacterized protein YqjF (DUF2071 family)